MKKEKQMEKTVERKGKNIQEEISAKNQIWDCGSSLYDSFELKSFERQLDSAIHSRTLSMPHLSDRRVLLHDNLLPNHHPPSSDQSKQQYSVLKKSSKISRSFQKLLRSVFKPKQNQRSLFQDHQSRDGFYVVYDKSAVLSTIPEGPEFDAGLSPEIRSLVRRTNSERFTATSIRISCA